MLRSFARILFIAEGQIGDLLLLTPALRAVKKSFPDADLSVVVLTRRGSPEAAGEVLQGPLPASANSVLAGNPHIDHLYMIDRRRLRLLKGFSRLHAEIEVVRFLRREKFDAVFSTFPEDRFALWARSTGAGIRVGDRSSPLSALYTRFTGTSKGEQGVLRYYLEGASALGAAADTERTEYYVPEECQSWADDTLRRSGVTSPFTLVHPGASGDYKIWPPENYARLIDRLQEESGLPVLLASGKGDTKIVERILERLTRGTIRLETGEHIGNLGGLLRRSALAVTNDSGPRHLAVALGVPSLSLFRKHHDKEWKAYADSPRVVTIVPEGECLACGKGRCDDVLPEGEEFGSHCLRKITPEKVVQEAIAILEMSRNTAV